MKQIIKRVLEEISTSQVNLTSAAARETVSSLISAALKVQGYNNKNKVNSYLTADISVEEKEARESWVCSICGENTYDVDYEYIGSCTNHLGCELENDRKPYINDNVDETDKDKKVDWFDDKRVTGDRRKGNRREKNWSQTKHEDKVFNHQSRIDKLAEEVVSDNDTDYIYESPDGGKTVYKRKVGGSERELVKDWKKINVRK